ncbi:MAG: transposase [Spirosoma sp.]|nr:transposase [Spirosoma sp.]
MIMVGPPMRPELISATMVKFSLKHGIEIRYTQPGKPMQNGLVKRLNGTIRMECLNLRVFQTISQVQEGLDICGAARAVAAI